MPNILITGAASGLGRAFLSHYITALFNLTNLESRIYAIDNSPAVHDAPLLSLESTQTPYSTVGTDAEAERLRLWIESYVIARVIDITSSEAVTELFDSELKGVSLDLVIHSAGIRGLVGGGASVKAYGDVREVESLDVMDKETMRGAWEVNVLGAFEVLRRLCAMG